MLFHHDHQWCALRLPAAQHPRLVLGAPSAGAGGVDLELPGLAAHDEVALDRAGQPVVVVQFAFPQWLAQTKEGFGLRLVQVPRLAGGLLGRDRAFALPGRIPGRLDIDNPERACIVSASVLRVTGQKRRAQQEQARQAHRARRLRPVSSAR